MSSLKTPLAALFLTTSTWISVAQEPPAPVAPIMREVSPGIYEIGKIHLDQKLRTARFPGEVNMKDGIIEKIVVHDGIPRRVVCRGPFLEVHP